MPLSLDGAYAAITCRESTCKPVIPNMMDETQAARGWQRPNARLVGASREEPIQRDLSMITGGPSDGTGLLSDVRFLIIDDCTVYRNYLAAVLASQGAAPPGVAWDLVSLIAAFEATQPRVILLNTATRDSAILLRQAMKLSPHVRVVVLGVAEDDEVEIVGYAEAGVAGYHLRQESLEDLLVLIHKVANGGSLCSPRVAAILLRRLTTLASQRRPAVQDLVLTSREIQILRMLELGLTNRDIADQLSIAIHTVKNHVHSLLTKLGVSTRAQAAARARTVLVLKDDPGN